MSKLSVSKAFGSKPVGTKPAVPKPPTKKMLTIKKPQPQKNIYNQLLITRTIPINIINIGSTIKETLGKAIAAQIEGKCIVDGYIKPNSVEIITFSSGLVMGSNVIFEVVIQCEVCSPVEGMLIKCVAKHINKAGIRAEINESPSPVVIFIARDHNYASPLFAEVKENDEIKVRVIGQRFELNDKYISIIAEIVEADKTTADSLPEGNAYETTAYEPTAYEPTVYEPTAYKATTLAPTALAPTILPEANTLAPTILPKATTLAPTTLAEPKPVTKKKATLRIKQPKITVNN